MGGQFRASAFKIQQRVRCLWVLGDEKAFKSNTDSFYYYFEQLRNLKRPTQFLN